jgi:copper(I)-binding protein
MKHHQAAGIMVMAVTMALTGCGGKNAKVSGAKSSASAHRHRAAHGATTVPGTVRAGAYCSVHNAALVSDFLIATASV